MTRNDNVIKLFGKLSLTYAMQRKSLL